MRKSFLWFLSFFVFFSKGQESQKIKLYTFCTPSHEVFKDEWFLATFQDDYDIVIKYYQQECAGGFKEEGWNNTMLHKVDLILEAIQENWDKMFVYADIDIQFFKPMHEFICNLMKNKDMVIQRNNPTGDVCAGFLVCRGNQKILRLWSEIRKLMTQKNKRDQQALNMLIRQRNPYNIKWDYLPDQFFGGGTLTGERWEPGQKLIIPNGIILHHANYSHGIENKIAQLEYVKEKVGKRG